MALVLNARLVPEGNVESHKLVLQEHLNHYGYLFGGNLLRWADEISWIAASLDYPACKFVTLVMDKVVFRKSVQNGAILRFDAQKSRVGTTSVQYTVNVYSRDTETGNTEPGNTETGDTGPGSEDLVFSTHVTFVCLNDRGQKTALQEV
jgi:acyl-CoA hydrolase